MMNGRKKVLTIILIGFVIFTGVIYAQQEEEPQNNKEQFEITEESKITEEKTEVESDIKDLTEDGSKKESEIETENTDEEKMKTESDISTELLDQESTEKKDTEESKSLSSDQTVLDSTADQTARIIEFEELFKTHPETESLYQEYKAKKEKVKAGENPEKDMEDLKESYLPLVVQNTKEDLKEFADAKDIDTLIINEKIVIGDDEYYPDKLTDIEDKTDEFKNFLNK